MIGRWGLYADLIRELRRAGFSADDSDRAARIAERAVRERRDEAIRAAAASGLSVRRIAATWGIRKSHVHRIVRASPDADGNGTGPAQTLPAKARRTSRSARS